MSQEEKDVILSYVERILASDDLVEINRLYQRGMQIIQQHTPSDKQIA
ncbi:MAG TPA: hypothetical protein VFV52_00645 [Bacilli bacterium]|nr:hypothetical protein [Bacilli bacterium]